jgi:hypothetical protein
MDPHNAEPTMTAPITPRPSHSQAPGLSQLLERAAARAESAGVFAQVAVQGELLECGAKSAAAPAFFRLSLEKGKLWASMVTADRWLSQSIEADLVHTGDKLEDLLGEELADLGYVGPAPSFEHFRSEDKLFTFRSVVPVDPSQFSGETAADTAAVFLLAYEACFRRLGDMDTTEE